MGTDNIVLNHLYDIIEGADIVNSCKARGIDIYYLIDGDVEERLFSLSNTLNIISKEVDSYISIDMSNILSTLLLIKDEYILTNQYSEEYRDRFNSIVNKSVNEALSLSNYVLPLNNKYVEMLSRFEVQVDLVMEFIGVSLRDLDIYYVSLITTELVKFCKNIINKMKALLNNTSIFEIIRVSENLMEITSIGAC